MIYSYYIERLIPFFIKAGINPSLSYVEAVEKLSNLLDTTHLMEIDCFEEFINRHWEIERVILQKFISVPNYKESLIDVDSNNNDIYTDPLFEIYNTEILIANWSVFNLENKSEEVLIINGVEYSICPYCGSRLFPEFNFCLFCVRGSIHQDLFKVELKYNSISTK